MKLLFLDLDGVLNSHGRWSNGWSGILQTHVQHLNRILAAEPELQIVLSSAWRYRFDTAWYVEALLCCHGIDCYERIHGVTAMDPVPADHPSYDDKAWWDAMGLRWRADQIRQYVAEHQPSAWIVLDDLPLEIENLIQTDGTVGLTENEAAFVIEVLANSSRQLIPVT